MSMWIPDIKKADGPRYQAIVDALEKAIQAKQVFPGQQLPTQRVLEYRPTQGIAPHRQAGVSWLERNGVGVDAENVIVTNGAAHGIWTAMASIVEPGDVVATEALVDTSIITNASILKLRLRGI